MGLSSALNTSVNGLSLNETAINVLGNNIANSGTTGFKQSEVQFATQLAQTLSYGAQPNSRDGGTDPKQIGLGAQVSATTVDFSQGSITASSSPSDLAVQGDGFFVLQAPDGSQAYTRDGSFRLDSGNKLSNAQGLRVLGYGVDSNYNLVTTALSPLTIPLGSLHVAQQTSEIVMGGALSPQGVVATQGTLQASGALVDAGNGNAPITAATLLTDVRNAADPATPLFTVGQPLSFDPSKGGRTVVAKSIDVSGGTTVADLETLMSNTLGLQGPPAYPNVPTDADGIAVGVSIDSTGAFQIKGNRGTVNDFDIPVGSLTQGGSAIPIAFTAGTNRANGESATTTFTTYDSLGTAITVRMSAVLESQGSNSTTYRYFLESADQTGNNIAIGDSTVTFDNQGRVSSSPNNQFTIDRSGTAAINPMIFTADLSQLSGISSTGSNLNLVSQNGASPGTLTSFVIDDQGKISGAFDNGVTRTLGQVVLSRFTNPQGLLQAGGDTYKAGVSSGLPQISGPGTFGAGSIRAGSLEHSNTDIGKNLVDLITASTNYQGNARVISAVNQLVNDLLQIGR